jgi:hypothetical protein
MERDEIAVDFGACFVIPDFYCVRYESDESGPALVDISDCTFYSLNSASSSGGGIYINNSICALRLSKSQFVRCEAVADGGAVWFSGTRAQIDSYFGVECSVHSDGFGTNADLQVQSSATGTIALNESTASLGKGGIGTFRILFLAQPVGFRAITTSVNASRNEASRGTGISFAECYSRMIQFCRFDSNAPTSVLCIGSSPVRTDEFLCLDFVNNSCIGIGGDVRTSCLISLSADCGFRDCVFVMNTMSYLAGVWESTPRVTFSNCLFDRDLSSDLFSITYHLSSCDLNTDSAILDQPRLCPRAGPTPVFTTMERIGLKRIRFLRGVLFTWPLFEF